MKLRWRWGPRTVQALVVARSGAEPQGADDPLAVRAVVVGHEYDQHGSYMLNLPTGEPGPWHIRVFSVALVDGEQVVSSGLELSAATVLRGPDTEVTLSYRLKAPIFPGRRWTMTIRTDPVESTVPPTVLVAHPRTMPLSVDDGQIVQHFPSCQDGQSFRIESPLNLADYRLRLFADPSADPATLTPVRFRHPESGGTRV